MRTRGVVAENGIALKGKTLCRDSGTEDYQQYWIGGGEGDYFEVRTSKIYVLLGL